MDNIQTHENIEPILLALESYLIIKTTELFGESTEENRANKFNFMLTILINALGNMSLKMAIDRHKMAQATIANVTQWYASVLHQHRETH